ncbi:MAG: methylated-DNA--[protein]-cysteine S-methyltransferase [Gammaproteobacteria bacterium]|nr:methylated-DNA--[protein]-cysteine S-methyltransferase [Gammaproteobacteria bacterium]
MHNANYQKIWKVVMLIPIGEVASYGQVADLAGLPGKARLVGRALRSAPAESGLPWHRVINAQRRISFPFASPGYILQRELLISEGIKFSGRTIDRAHQWRPDLSLLLWELDS